MIILNAANGIPCNLSRVMNTILATDGRINLRSYLLVKFDIPSTVRSEIQVGILGGSTTVFINKEVESDDKLEQKVTSSVIGLRLEYVKELGNKSTIYGGPTIIYSAIRYKPCVGYGNTTDGFGIYPHMGVTSIISASTTGYLEVGYGKPLLNVGLKIGII